MRIEWAERTVMESTCPAFFSDHDRPYLRRSRPSNQKDRPKGFGNLDSGLLAFEHILAAI
jgi:hypothetical protein